MADEIFNTAPEKEKSDWIFAPITDRVFMVLRNEFTTQRTLVSAACGGEYWGPLEVMAYVIVDRPKSRSGSYNIKYKYVSSQASHDIKKIAERITQYVAQPKWSVYDFYEV